MNLIADNINSFYLLIGRLTHSFQSEWDWACWARLTPREICVCYLWHYDGESVHAHLLCTIRSTSTEESILKVVISLTTEDGHMMSITLLWIFITYLSQVLVPSPQGDFLVVILKTFVGILTGPLTSYPLFLALVVISLQASSRCLTSLPLSCTLNTTKTIKKSWNQGNMNEDTLGVRKMACTCLPDSHDLFVVGLDRVLFLVSVHI